jgi:hypothetical protein
MRSILLVAVVASLPACTADVMMEMEGPDAMETPSPDAPPERGPPTAAELRAAVATCDTTIGGPFAADSGGVASISICGRTGFVHWTADMDIDCDGKETPECNLDTDPYFMSSTAAVDSNGDPLDSAGLPFVVLPLRSSRFDYRAAGLSMGSVFAVVYGDRVEYGVAGDLGPSAIIGEASYAMAVSLGIDPDPSTGGTDGDVIYIGFTGDAAEIDPIEDHAAAVTLGQALVRSLVAP